MAVTAQQIKTAKDAGYTDDEIISHLSSDPQVKTAIKAGYKPSEIIGYFQPTDSRVIRQDATYTEDPKVIERERRKFAEQEDPTIMGSVNRGLSAVKNAITPDRQTLATMLRPTLEGGGMIAGEALGLPLSPVTAGASIPAGGGLGYAAGKGVADLIEGRQDTTLASLARDVDTGAKYSMGGGIAGKLLIEPAVKGYQAVRGGLKDLAKRKAQELAASTSQLTTQEAANAVKAAELSQRTGAKFTPAQATGKPSLAALEEQLATADPTFRGTLAAQDTASMAAGQNRVLASLGKGKPLPSAPDLQQAGQSTVATVNKALEPVKKAERELWDAVPEYVLPTSSTDDAFKAALSVPSTAEEAVKKIQAIYARTPKTTAGMHRVEQEIGSAMQTATATEKAYLGKIKQAINDDFAAMSQQAKNGDIALHNGQVVYPSKLEAEYAKNAERIAAEQATNAAKPDARTIYAELQATGYPAMRQTAEPEAGYLQRITKAYEQNFPGKPIPTSEGANTKSIAQLTERNAQIEKMFTELQPAEDIAAAYKAAKDFSRDKKFAIFGIKTPVGKVLEKADTMPAENINRQLFTPSGANSLIKSIGQKAAGDQMRPFVLADMLKNTAKDGTNMDIQAAINYVQRNRGTLERLGLTKDAQQLIKEQYPNYIQNLIGKRAADPVTGAQFLTAQEVRTILTKQGSTIKQLFGNDALTAFRDYNAIMGNISRKNIIPRGGNSNTNDKAVSFASTMIAKSTGPAKKLTDGLLAGIVKGAGLLSGGGMLTGTLSPATVAAGGSMGAIYKMAENANGIVAQQYAKILQEATLNPAMAKDLMTLSRTGKIPATLQAIIDKNLTGAAAIGANQ